MIYTEKKHTLCDAMIKYDMQWIENFENRIKYGFRLSVFTFYSKK